MNYIKEDFIIDDKTYNLLIGKNARGNNEIIKLSKQNDIWFHLKSDKSAHIVLQNNGDKIHKRYLCCIADKLRKYVDQKVVYTEIKNVKLTEIDGKVITKKLNTI